MTSSVSWNSMKPPLAGQRGTEVEENCDESSLTGCATGSEQFVVPKMCAAATAKDVADCISCWLAYLQMLNGLCNAGSRLSQCLCGLAQENHIMASHCQAMWEELVRASTVASSCIKTNVLPALQELNLGDSECERPRSADANQTISNSLAAFIHLQYQFCSACCECLGPVLGCPCPPEKHETDCSAEAMLQCFQRLFPHPARSPLSFPPVPIPGTMGCQRRWSEAAAQDVNMLQDTDGIMRRWSMPWENSKVSDQQAAWPGSRLMPKNKLTVPGTASQDRSRSTTPESIWHSSMASQEELQEVIQLLSCPLPEAGTQSTGKPTLPGVILTGCGFDPGQSESWSEGTTPGSRRGSNSPHRGVSWQGQVWSDGDPPTPSGSGTDGNYELTPTTLDPAAIASRKSSSSTDSSSSYSLHNRSTTGSISDGPQEIRTQLYSMWSGSDLPFIKLSESAEVNDKTPTDVNQSFFTPNPI